MARKSVKRVKIDAAKESAPKVPGDTCPSIDYVQTIVNQIAERGDTWATKQAELITDLLEYVSDSNYELRKSSKYWYDKYKESV